MVNGVKGIPVRQDFGPWGVVTEDIRYNPAPLEPGGKSAVVIGRAQRRF